MLWKRLQAWKRFKLSHFRKKLEQKFVYQKRRPWNENTNTTQMVNDVTWITGAELEENLVSEFDVISDEKTEEISKERKPLIAQ